MHRVKNRNLTLLALISFSSATCVLIVSGVGSTAYASQPDGSPQLQAAAFYQWPKTKLWHSGHSWGTHYHFNRGFSKFRWFHGKLPPNLGHHELPPPFSPPPPTPPPPSAGGNTIFGVQELPGNNMLNTRVDSLNVDPNSDSYIGQAGASNPVYADFNSVEYNGSIIGIPYTAVPASGGSFVNVTFTLYGDESDPGPYFISFNPKVEGSPLGTPDANGELGTHNGSGDSHEITLNTSNGVSYELFLASPNADGSWSAASGAIFPMNSNLERTAGWTSACAYGYTLLVPLVKFAEVQSGAINHAVGMTWHCNGNQYLWPGNHLAGSSSGPPMASYLRLKRSFNISGATPQAKIVLQAMQTYGCILQENGSDAYINGDSNTGWNHDDLAWIKNNVTIGDLEFIDVASLEISPSTAQAQQPGSPAGITGDLSGSGTASAMISSHHMNCRPRAK